MMIVIQIIMIMMTRINDYDYDDGDTNHYDYDEDDDDEYDYNDDDINHLSSLVN